MLVELLHRSSIPNARWCKPIGWEPLNEIAGADFIDGTWWTDSEEEAAIVCFLQGDEGEKVEADLEELRVASAGDVRVIGRVKV